MSSLPPRREPVSAGEHAPARCPRLSNAVEVHDAEARLRVAAVHNLEPDAPRGRDGHVGLNTAAHQRDADGGGVWIYLLDHECVLLRKR